MDNTAQWYIVQAFSGKEERVKKLLLEQLHLKNRMDEIEIFIPAEDVIVKKNGKERKRKITYFPGYILLKMILDNELWHIIKSLPNVSGFIGGTPTKPEAISETELANIKAQINSGLKQSELNSIFEIGQTVNISDGPFSGFNGIVENVDLAKNKIIVAVNIFGRSTPLELDFDKVKKVTNN